MTPHPPKPSTPPVPAEDVVPEDAASDERGDGLTVSDAGSSFHDHETTSGGADAVPSTPDSTPRDNHEENDDLSQDDLLA